MRKVVSLKLARDHQQRKMHVFHNGLELVTVLTPTPGDTLGNHPLYVEGHRHGTRVLVMVLRREMVPDTFFHLPQDVHAKVVTSISMTRLSSGDDHLLPGLTT